MKTSLLWKSITQIQEDRRHHGASSPKWIYLLFCFNFFFLLAHGFTAVLTLPCPEERDAAEAELFRAPNIFREVESGLDAAATLPPRSGFPGELEQRGAFKIHLNISRSCLHRQQEEGISWKFTCGSLSV